MTVEALYITIALLSVTVLGLLGLTYWQHNLIQVLRRPKFGFLGKPLTNIVVLMVIGGTGFVGSLTRFGLVPQEQFVSGGTEDQLTLDVLYNVTKRENGSDYLLNILAVPSLGSKEWLGNADTNFRLKWRIYDAKSVLVFTKNTTTSALDRKSLEIVIAKGTYRVVAELQILDGYLSKTVTIKIGE